MQIKKILLIICREFLLEKELFRKDGKNGFIESISIKFANKKTLNWAGRQRFLELKLKDCLYALQCKMNGAMWNTEHFNFESILLKNLTKKFQETTL